MPHTTREGDELLPFDILIVSQMMFCVKGFYADLYTCIILLIGIV